MRVRAFLTVFLILWSAVTLSLDAWCLWAIARQEQARWFPTVQGVITASGIHTQADSEGGATYAPEIRYTYRVGNTDFTSDARRFGEAHASGLAAAQALASAYPVNSPVTVSYDPGNPSSAILSPGVEGSDLFMLTFLTPFNAIGAALALALLLIAAPNALGGQRIGGQILLARHDAVGLRLYPWYAPAFVPIALAGALGFIASFAIGFSVGFRPPLFLAATVLASIAGTAVCSWLLARRRWSSGRYDLWIQQRPRSVTIPASITKSEPETLAHGVIQAVECSTSIAPHSSGEDSPTFAVKLHLDSRPPLTLFTTGSRPHAAEAAAWFANAAGLPPPIGLQ